jgi:hypothetical protein
MESKKYTARKNAPRNYLATFESLPEIFFNTGMGNIVTDLFLHGHLPAENFLVSESMGRIKTSQTIIPRAHDAHPCKGPANANSDAE